MTYYINAKSVGLKSENQAIQMAEMLQEDGYMVEHTDNPALIATNGSCDVPEHIWDSVLDVAEIIPPMSDEQY